MSSYPGAITEVGHVEPVARRIRATLGGATVLDTTRALYLWEWPFYPQFWIPLEDVDEDALVDEQDTRESELGSVTVMGLRAGGLHRPGVVRRCERSHLPGLAGTVRFDWSALDHWYEEDEEVFVHPRSPYVRVDALRSSRRVRVELDGELLAESTAPVLVFETGLPTRHYFDRGAVALDRLERTETVTECPYKGRTTDTWAVHAGGARHADLAWSYAFPTRELLPIAGLVAFYDEKVDTFVDGVAQPRPRTHFG